MIVTLRFAADAAKVEEFAAGSEAHMREIVEAAKGHGLIAHRFYGTDDGKLMVVDEWPDAESFQAFFAEQEPQIEPIMQAAGVTSDPEVVLWRKLDSRDDHGWE